MMDDSKKEPTPLDCVGGMCGGEEIIRAHEVGDIVIHPFDPENVGPNSYDVRLGSYFHREVRNQKWEVTHVTDPDGKLIRVSKQLIRVSKQLVETRSTVIPNPYVHPTSRYFTYQWQPVEKATSLKCHMNGYDCNPTEFPPGKYIIVKPGELILAHTEEFIGSRRNYTMMLKARSSMGRSGITICKCAGLGDKGYFNRMTLEIKNDGTQPFPLRVGMRVGQMAFIPVSTSLTYKGKYQSEDDLKRLIDNWDPKTAMLPKLYLDREVIAAKLLTEEKKPTTPLEKELPTHYQFDPSVFPPTE